MKEKQLREVVFLCGIELQYIIMASITHCPGESKVMIWEVRRRKSLLSALGDSRKYLYPTMCGINMFPPPLPWYLINHTGLLIFCTCVLTSINNCLRIVYSSRNKLFSQKTKNNQGCFSSVIPVSIEDWDDFWFLKDWVKTWSQFTLEHCCALPQGNAEKGIYSLAWCPSVNTNYPLLIQLQVFSVSGVGNFCFFL